jgi:hypothetical protein
MVFNITAIQKMSLAERAKLLAKRAIWATSQTRLVGQFSAESSRVRISLRDFFVILQNGPRLPGSRNYQRGLRKFLGVGIV